MSETQEKRCEHGVLISMWKCVDCEREMLAAAIHGAERRPPPTPVPAPLVRMEDGALRLHWSDVVGMSLLCLIVFAAGFLIGKYS